MVYDIDNKLNGVDVNKIKEDYDNFVKEKWYFCEHIILYGLYIMILKVLIIHIIRICLITSKPWNYFRMLRERKLIKNKQEVVLFLFQVSRVNSLKIIQTFFIHIPWNKLRLKCLFIYFYFTVWPIDTWNRKLDNCLDKTYVW